MTYDDIVAVCNPRKIFLSIAFCGTLSDVGVVILVNRIPLSPVMLSSPLPEVSSSAYLHHLTFSPIMSPPLIEEKDLKNWFMGSIRPFLSSSLRAY